MKNITHDCLGYLARFVFFIIFLTGCKEDNPLFKGDKREYASKADVVRIYTGKNRLQIKFVVPNADLVSAKVFWNDRKDFVEIPINTEAETDTISTIIGPLDEGNYAFEIITSDAHGNTSIPIKVSGQAWGSQYEKSLPNRPVNDIFYENGKALIIWGKADQGLLTEVTYTDMNNLAHTLKVPATADSTLLENLKPGPLTTDIQYRTAFFPELAIDTFFAESKTQPVITGSLKDLAQTKNIFFGSLISYGGGVSDGVIYDASPNGVYTDFCKREFNIGQATWGPSRWSITGPSNFNDVNAVINWSRQQYDKVMAMLIVGPDNYMPSWFTTGNFTPEEMDVMLKNLVAEIMTSNDNKTKVDEWCVANELFNNDGTYRTMKWNDMGWEDDASGLTGSDQINLKHPIFVGKAFRYCREITQALLELRDYGIEHGESSSTYYYKHKAYYQLLKHLLATDTPVDVVGIQAHVWIGDNPTGNFSDLTNTIQKFRQLGLGVYLTELDVAANKVNSQIQPWTPMLADQQKKDYDHYVQAAIAGGIDLISLWGVRDNNDAGWLLNQHPLLLDENYTRKSAYYGLQHALFETK